MKNVRKKNLQNQSISSLFFIYILVGFSFIERELLFIFTQFSMILLVFVLNDECSCSFVLERMKWKHWTIELKLVEMICSGKMGYFKSFLRINWMANRERNEHNINYMKFVSSVSNEEWNEEKHKFKIRKSTWNRWQNKERKSSSFLCIEGWRIFLFFFLHEKIANTFSRYFNSLTLAYNLLFFSFFLFFFRSSSFLHWKYSSLVLQ